MRLPRGTVPAALPVEAERSRVGFGWWRSSFVDDGKQGLTCGNAITRALGVAGNRRVRLGFLRTVCGLLGHGEMPLARAASNSVRATCSAFSVAAAPTGFAS